jgi:NAD(P)-dependent dehydrogenase (short-subunit alcohol dehydrogenase family)
MGKLDGKVAVITGGASGIGEAAVRLFVEEGARVVIADVQQERGSALAAELGAAAAFQRTDVTREGDVKAAVARAVSGSGRLDCMFNNAGSLGTVGPIEDIPLDEYESTMQLLLRSVFLGMKHASPAMKAQGSGSVINTSSVAGIIAGDGPHIYTTAKAAVIQLTKSVALELAEHSVRVNAICPGATVTPLVLAGVPNTPQAEDAVRASFARYQPIPRAGMPIDMAQAALWLASDDSTFVTGQAIVVDGGLTSGKPWSKQPPPFRVHTPKSRG